MYPVHLPVGVERIAADYGNGSEQVVHVGAPRRAAAQQLAEPELLHDAGQTAGPTARPEGGGSLNIVFVSAGYKDPGGHTSARDRYIANIGRCMRYLQFPENFGLVDGEIAIARYFSTFNVFAVWQESAENGASKPVQGLVRDNNLQCTYGKGTSRSPARALTCSQALIVAMADVSPVTTTMVNTLVIVLVNDPDYGGTGAFGSGTVKYATFYNGALEGSSDSAQRAAASLLYHEVQHAHADLADEYVVGIAENQGYNCEPTTTSSFGDRGSWGFPTKYSRPAGESGSCEKNCAFNREDLPWESWKPTRQGSAFVGMVDETPSRGCFYSNWFKPGTGTGDNCLMEELAAPRLCPVCREAGVLQLYTDGMDLTFPVCPHPAWSEVIVSQFGEGSRVTFFANDRLFGDPQNGVGKPDMEVAWAIDGAVVGGSTASFFTLDATLRLLPVGLHKVAMHASDNSQWVLPNRRPTAMRQTTIEWNVRVVTTLRDITALLAQEGVPSDAMLGECESRGAFFQHQQPSAVAGWPRDPLLTSAARYSPYLHYRRCVGPTPEGNASGCSCVGRKECTCLTDATGSARQCTLSYSARKYQQPRDLEDVVTTIETWLFGAGAAAIAGGIALFALLHYCLVRHYGRNPTRAVEDTFTQPIRWTRVIMMVSAVVFAVIALCGFVLIAAFYTQVGAVARVGLLIALAFFVLMFFGAITGFLAAYYRTLPMLFLNGVGLAFGAFGCVACGIALYYAGYESNNTGSGVQSTFESSWRNSVRDNPEQVCATQKLFSCTGWDVPCHQFQPPSNCPVNCEVTNAQYADTCKVEIISFVHYWFPVGGSIAMVVSYVLLVGLILNVLLYVAIKHSDELNAHKMKILMEGPIQSMLKLVHMSKGGGQKFIDKATAEFHKIDLDRSGGLDKAEFKMFFRRLVGMHQKFEGRIATQSAAQFEEKLDAVFELLDLDNSGDIQLGEWVEVLRLASAMGMEPLWSEYQRKGRTRDEYDQDYSAWKQRAATFRQDLQQRNLQQDEKAEERRARRIEQLRQSEETNLPLEGVPLEPPDPDGDPLQVDAWRLLGWLSDEQWSDLVNTFNELAVSDSGQARFIFTDQPSPDRPPGYKQWLEARYKRALKRRVPLGEGYSRRRLLRLLEELPSRIDKDDNGQLDFCEWVATFYIRSRDLEVLEWVRTYKETLAEKAEARRRRERRLKEERRGTAAAGSIELGRNVSSAALNPRERRSSTIGWGAPALGAVSGIGGAAQAHPQHRARSRRGSRVSRGRRSSAVSAESGAPFMPQLEAPAHEGSPPPSASGAQMQQFSFPARGPDSSQGPAQSSPTGTGAAASSHEGVT